MSDGPGNPANQNVEEVLTSIRRLVSSETEARLRETSVTFSGDKGDEEREAGDAATSLLVLTSDFRVDEETRAEALDTLEKARASATTPAAMLAPVPGPAPAPRLHLGVPDQAPVEDAPKATSTEAAKAPVVDDAYRDEIRAILRAELEGELGDRITRNVVKLVRREIARALRIDTEDL